MLRLALLRAAIASLVVGAAHNQKPSGLISHCVHSAWQWQDRSFSGILKASTFFGPGVTRSANVRPGFVNRSDVRRFNSDGLNMNATPKVVHIKRNILGRKQYLPRRELLLATRTREDEIEHTALSVVTPSRFRFHYKRGGNYGNVMEAGTRSAAFYTNINPGTCKFQVIACNDGIVWSEKRVLCSLTLGPGYYQTRRFRCLCAFLILLALWIVYQLRVRHVAARLSLHFNARLAERTHLARELHDTLLQTIQGSKLVADDALFVSADLDRTRQALERVSCYLERAIEEGRQALYSLRSSTTRRNDLAERFQRVANNFANSKSIKITLSVEGAQAEIHPIARDEIYRVGHEAISNACRHSGATRLKIQIVYAQDLILRVSDNGIGIELKIVGEGKGGHFGLQGMRERAKRIGGKLNLSTTRFLGTTIELVAPGNVVFQGTRSALRSWLEGVKRALGWTGQNLDTDI